jgi:large subunit ribosomal protein L21
MTVYAVIETGGKQYKVSYNDIVKIEKIPGTVGDMIEFKDVLLLKTGEDLKVEGNDLKDVTVKGKIIAQEKDTKVIVFKFKRRHNFKKKKGHRQPITRVIIKEISLGKNILTLEDMELAAARKEQRKIDQIKEAEKIEAAEAAIEEKAEKSKKKEKRKKAISKISKKAEKPKTKLAKKAPALKKSTKNKHNTKIEKNIKSKTKKEKSSDRKGS